MIKLLVHTGIFCGAILLIPGPAQSAASKPTVWVVSGMERVGQEDPPQKKHRIELFAARGEYEPFQIVVRASSPTVSTTCMSTTAVR